MSSFSSQVVWAAFTIYIAAVNTIYVLFIVPFIIFLWLMLIKYFMHTYREVSRLESITSSPIITNLSETIDGVSTIKAFQKEKDFIQKYYQLQDKHANAHFWQIWMNSWVGVRAEFISMAILVFTSFFWVIEFSLISHRFGIKNTQILYGSEFYFDTSYGWLWTSCILLETSLTLKEILSLLKGKSSNI